MRPLGALRDRSPRIGILYPCSGTRDRDFWDLAPSGASVHVTRLPFASEATADAIIEMSSEGNLQAAAKLLAAVQPDAVVWADTSGSFLFGPQGDLHQIELLEALTEAKATTTSTALVAACAALGIGEIDVASPYVNDLNEAFERFLEMRGLAVSMMVSLELDDSYVIASVSEDEQRSLLRSVRGSAPALVVPCTDFLSLSLIPEMEEELGKPIIAANPATMWHAAALLGIHRDGAHSRMRLFEAQAKVSP